VTVVRVLPSSRTGVDWKESAYRGDILIFTQIPPLIELCAITDELIRSAFDDLDPVFAQFALDPDSFVAAVDALQRRYRRDAQARRLFASTLQCLGLDLRHSCWDWLYLRVMPSGDRHASRQTQALGFHRDTWSSNVYAQLNWWTPIYPLTAERSLAFYPAYWSMPLQNTSAEWDLEKISANPGSTPVVPAPSEPVDTSAELIIVPEPGDAICFSGAHLHASVPNTSGATRFSIEVRTVDVDDVRAGTGAPNVDGEAPHEARRWFHRVTDGAALTELAPTPS